jgi:predicted dehydrogenase
VAENYRFLPQLPLVRELLKAVGPVAAAEVVLRRSRAPRGWRIDRALSGGGVLADMGVHYVHLLRLLLGELAVDAAEERARVPGTDCDATFFLAGTSEKGARWSIELSWRSLRRRSSVILRGERGTLRFRVGRLGVWRVGWLGIPLGRRVAPGDDPYGQEALHDDWLRAVARGETGAVSLAEGIRDLAIVDFAYALAGRAERK